MRICIGHEKSTSDVTTKKGGPPYGGGGLDGILCAQYGKL